MEATIETQPGRRVLEKLCVRVGRVIASFSVVIAAALLATMVQYTAQHGPGTRAAFALEGAIDALGLPAGQELRHPQAYRKRAREIEDRFDSSVLPDGTIRPEYRELWDRHTSLYLRMMEHRRLAPWRWTGEPDVRRAVWTDFERAPRAALVEPIDWRGVLASSWHAMLAAPGDANRWLGGGRTLSHPPAMGFWRYLDREGVMADGACFVPDWSSLRGAASTLKFQLPFVLTMLSGIDVVWYALYHALAVSVVVGVCRLGRWLIWKGARRGRMAAKSGYSFVRVLMISAVYSVPLPAFFEIIWKAWWAHELSIDPETGHNIPNGIVLTTPSLAGVWLGIALMHLLIVMSLRRGTSLDLGIGKTTGLKKVRVWFAYRWWQLAMLVAAFVFFWTPMLMGWFNRLSNEGVI